MINHILAEELTTLRHAIQNTHPLIHCITNPISINDCANIVLAVGSRPIMAEHPEEVAEITATAQTLCLNLGSITSDRLKAIKIAAKTAKKNHIPIIIDIVGAACSTLRNNFLKDFLQTIQPDIIKGNISEALSICGNECHSSGVEANKEQLITLENAQEYAQLFAKWAQEHRTVLLISGPLDFITDGSSAYLISNGVPMMGHITGTGCMLNALTAAYMPAGRPLAAALLATLSFGITGELAEKSSQGPGTFHMQLFDAIYNLKDGDIIANGKITELKK